MWIGDVYSLERKLAGFTVDAEALLNEHGRIDIEDDVTINNGSSVDYVVDAVYW